MARWKEDVTGDVQEAKKLKKQKIAPPRFDRGTCGWLELILSETVYLYGPTTLPLSYGAEGES